MHLYNYTEMLIPELNFSNIKQSLLTISKYIHSIFYLLFNKTKYPNNIKAESK